MKETELRPAYMVYPALFPLLMMNYWARHSKRPIAAILISDYDIKHKGKHLNFFELVLGLSQECGFAYTAYMLKIAKFAVPWSNFRNFLSRLAGKKIRIKTFEQIAREKGIPLYRSKDFNGEETRAFLKKVNANLIVSAYNNQILKRETFDFPRFRSINIHPALLPNFRGLDGPFEAMYHKVQQAGVSIHFIDEGIDTGRVIVQAPVEIRPEDTLFSLSVRCWMRGAKLLENVFDMLESGDAASWEQNPEDIQYPYQSFPAKGKVKEFFLQGGKLFTG